MRREIIKELQIYIERNMKPNYSKLAAEYGIDRRTVKKYFNNPNPERKKRPSVTALAKYDSIIKDKIKVTGITFAGIYTFLKNEKGLELSYNSLTNYCRKNGLRLTGSEDRPHVRFTTPPGHQVQVDWKENIILHTRSGIEICFNVFSATLGYSRKHLFIYSRTKTEQDFIRCTNAMLLGYGGATDEILTDNMSAIVSISSEGKIRRKHGNILNWERDSGVKIRLCKPRSPETKGKDESANRFLSRILAYDNEIDNEDDIIEALRKIQNDANDKVNDEIGMAPEALFQAKEKQALHPLPNMSLLASYLDGGMTQKVPNTLLVPFQGRCYSVPPEYIGLRVRILRNGDNIDIYYNNVCIATHEFDEKRRINYGKDHYMQGLRKSIGTSDVDLDSLAESNLKGFDSL